LTIGGIQATWKVTKGFPQGVAPGGFPPFPILGIHHQNNAILKVQILPLERE
jgi:hypothetical protein